METKFTVIKNDDLGLLNWVELDRLRTMLDKINAGRAIEGKKENTYIVINTDEPYAEQVTEIMKEHGHWNG